MSNSIVEALVDTLRAISVEKSTGLLRVSTDYGLRMAFFEDGDLVYFASEDARESAREFLAAPEHFGDEESRERLDALSDVKKSLVAQVVESGLADADRLRPWLLAYARESFARAFDDREGSVKFVPKIKAEHPVSFRVPARVVVLESVRGMRDADAVREAVGPLTAVATPREDHMERLMSLPLDFKEGAVGSRLTSPMSIKDLVQVSDLPEADALRAILALRSADVLAPFEEPKELTDTGRLRRRKAALESGVAVDVAAAAALLGVTPGRQEEDAEAAPLVMADFDVTSNWNADAFAAPAEAPPAVPPARSKGDSGPLRVLASAYIQMAEVEAASGNYNGAVRYFETALEQKPGELTVILPFASYLLSFERPQTTETAERLLRQGCAMNPRAVEPRLELAKLYRAAGRHANAIEILSDAERIAPHDERVRAMLKTKARGLGGALFGRLRGQ